METLLFWNYIITMALLINHEIDSAYWHEWKLFNLKGGVDGFLWIHIPIWIFFLWAIVQIYLHSFAGIIIALIASFIGIGCFFIHRHFIKKGHEEFTSFVSQFHLRGILLTSINMAIISIYLLIT